MAQSYSNLLELMKARHSVRSYDPRPVEKEKLDYIVEAFRVAPSAKNIQPWHLVIVSERNTIDKLVEACYGQSFIGQAPLVVAVVGDERIAYGRLGDFTSSLLVDIGIAFEHLVLAAWEQGGGRAGRWRLRVPRWGRRWGGGGGGCGVGGFVWWMLWRVCRAGGRGCTVGGAVFAGGDSSQKQGGPPR
ncbi:nitroreductase family protein [Candidatus Hakubella thermalkaliphila]|uniref:Nitroreductase domain-containing protein n=1 Tax=Candidatus Hakubella thermalkaliphila TaxID=2754717 RepID=A0A6V8PFU2_9ACTN|nr:nitroreductase family protein [Candidatus Hakubella thermalkaliphila]GFP31118.1 hypothetical protein HKBW3S34_02037 [Candidatus Hakubella thermalkaliphila]